MQNRHCHFARVVLGETRHRRRRELEPEGAHGMNMCVDNLCNASGQEIPNDDPPIVAADGQKRTPSVERTRHRGADAVQGPVKILTTR